LSGCYQDQGTDHLKPATVQLTEEYSINWEEDSAVVVDLAGEFLKDFGSGSLGDDLAFSLHIAKKIKSRSPSTECPDASFTSRLQYDNLVLMNLIRTRTQFEARQLVNGKTIDCFHPGISELQWLSMVFADMNALHSRPIVAAFLLGLCPVQSMARTVRQGKE
jgi:hypothetical protein